jgi:hypothetical protein
MGWTRRFGQVGPNRAEIGLGVGFWLRFVFFKVD